MECNGIPENTAVSGNRPSFPTQPHKGRFWKNWIVEYYELLLFRSSDMVERHSSQQDAAFNQILPVRRDIQENH